MVNIFGMAVTALKKAWHWLTSMRTALMLLFVLAVAAIPGALLPQRSLNESKVIEYIQANGKVAEIYDKLQLFDVFSSTWFTAIFTLLFFSLIGCIIPRSWDHYKAMKTPPVRAPKVLARMPHHGKGSVEKPIDAVAEDIRGVLKGWHLAEYSPHEDRAGARSFAAEKGYLREFFNLTFHLGLVGILVAVAVGKLWSYEGQVIIIASDDPNQNSEFCNTATANFDSFRAGALFDGTGLHPFCFVAHSFVADYLPTGQAEMFTSEISYATGEEMFADPETWQDYTLKVNHPLRLAGDRIYLQGHGYAPTFTVTWPNGEQRTQTIQWQPTDPTFFLSSGVMRFDPPAGLYPDLFERRQQQIAIQGLFAPTAQWEGDSGSLLTSSFPAMTDPAVAIDIYRGDNGLDTGRGQSIFELDPSLIQAGQLQRVDRVNLTVGEQVTLDDGTRITFDGAQEFANYQISHDPSQNWVLLFALVTIASLSGSLFVKRRRIWVRLRPVTDSVTLVETAGLARTDRAGWGEEYERVHRGILGLPEPDEED
ncbi:cytochrome c biogenesis protein ResB [Corynebacterium sp. 153RC1]|uniref:cytochrome c biogenesis protein ResB n=1 Tax=unclassified Corynebacterium TaxID=2624378 RepID=UPI00211CD441|nr:MULTISPECIES: cytochrome c biogenesis protein ResB [unclassified Corynebacterium]MCQ9370514.1 cytochrome c biogenesis protein ResB [Corynebacterium sp. 35RC1]MCQ9351787.1 cytochrome c biogenesis protein ResB [Corynebacterium sp. 209RC1]MCQ9354523.1 cytochrome c biogenesis protein ResB [Corynebacterium sp. 1222RC1]MCQ9356069.1 cytochrome c biogenesis protein ResB [Corynebacterium sp. 122RC1]MCQ9358701.1 cytochrome c biogenesis protein ResB [Corynebacterium sp. 142RC1]